MGRTTSILWTKSTLNLAWGCTKVSTECDQCYMFRYSKRIGRDPERIQILTRGFENTLARIKPLQDLIFVNNMSDTFHIGMPFNILDEWFDAFEDFSVSKTFQILTKRPAIAIQYFKHRGSVPKNCWIGVSCGIERAKNRIDLLRQIDAKVRFVSFEPLLEDLRTLDLKGIHWAIIGGESDFKAPRPMNLDWVRNIIKQCREQNVAVFFKQVGGIGGDNAGGCLIDNQEIKEFPLLGVKTYE